MNNKMLIKRFASIIVCAIALIISLLFAGVSLVLNSSDDAVEDITTTTSSDDASQVFIESSALDVDDEENTTDLMDDSKIDDNSAEPDDAEPKHCFIKNKYGITFVYGDSGFEQFNYGNATLNTYIDSLNAFAEHFSEETSVYNITVPVSTTFVDIPSEIKTEHDFYNKSQSAFVDIVQAGLDESIINIPIVGKIQERYDNGEYLFFRTDNNWTSSASYTAYTSFCDIAGINPYSISSFPEKEIGDYLGRFHFATQDADMASNPDEFIYYSPIPSIKTALTVYDNGSKLNNYKLCSNSVDIYSAYDVFVGTTAGRYEIVSTTKGGNLLIIGDNSVLPMLPFLVSHYGKIDVINPLYFDVPLSEFLKNRYYSEVITMCYTTNATAGNYMPAFREFIGAADNNE